MKESFNYEHRTTEMEKSLQVGVTCSSLVIGGIYKALKPTVEYRVKHAIHRRQRRTR